MARIPEEEIAEVRKRADIADIIGRYLTVQKKGRDFKAICPFHDDHDPSLSINREMQIYKCFVCGAGGSVFTFVQEYEHVSFPEAVEKVADLIGFPLSVQPARAEVQTDPKKEQYYRVLKEANRFLTYEMNTENASVPREYLEKRGLTEEIRSRFEIGYNPGGNRLSAFLRAKGYSDADMVSVNIARTGTSGISDVFSNRITFPIHDANGNPIGFSARTLDKDNPSKYVNTTDTELFHKGDIVYNAHRAKMAARRSGKLYVCEGVTDVIAFARAGVENAVCTLGTACTKQQLNLMRSMAPRIVFCYDGDAAGQNATMKAGRLARSLGCEVAVISNDTGLDPDELIREGSADALVNMLKKELSWMEFVLKFFQQRTNFDNYQEKKEFVQKIQSEIETLDDEVDRRYFTDELSRISGITLSYRPREARLPRQMAHSGAGPRRDGLENAEEQVLALMLAHKDASQRFSQDIGFLPDNTRNAVAMMIIDFYRTHETIEPSELLDRCETQEQRNLVTRLIDSWVYSADYDTRLLDGAIRKVNIGLKSASAERYKEELSHVSGLSPETKLVIMNEYMQCLNDLKRYIDEENRESNRA